jgi:RNA polymerase sigma-70 factor, ECF subfamily
VPLDAVFRDQWGRVLATLTGFQGDIELAEDAAQEAFAIAAERWPRDGEPANPAGWLIATARNRAIDRISQPAETIDQTTVFRDEWSVTGTRILGMICQWKSATMRRDRKAADDR